MNTTTSLRGGNGISWQVVVTALVLLVGFTYYYAVGAKYLPRGAGPDSAAHHDIAKFIYQNKRLAAFPEDEAKLLFTPYGTSRALRPPLSYIASAVIAGVVHKPDRDLFKALRVGSGVLCALAAAITFITIWLLFSSYWLALVCALLFGLLPQLAFIGIYTNDDSSAIFSATLFVMAVVLVHQYNLRLWTALLLGASIGLVILSKFTAWLLLPILLGFLLPETWHSRRKLPVFLPSMLVAFVLGGGWWLGFNMIQYGVDDPLLFKISKEVSENHARIATPDSRGFASRGISPYQLIVGNYKNFIGESYKATIGNLDWLRLRLGWWQYGPYLLVMVWAFLYVPISSVAKFGRHSPATGEPSTRLLYWSLFLAILFQVYMYVYFNLYHDIQIQGKYMLPVLLPVLILFSAGVLATKRLIIGLVKHFNIQSAESKFIAFSLFILALVIIVGSHLHGLKTYFLPFYYPDAFRYNVRVFKTVDLRDKELIQAVNGASLVKSLDGISIETLEQDPQLLLNAKLCKLFSTNTLLQIDLTADSPGDLKIYIDDGSGFSEANSSGQRYDKGVNRLVLAIGVDACRNIRIDPRSTPGTVTINRIAIAPFQILTH